MLIFVIVCLSVIACAFLRVCCAAPAVEQGDMEQGRKDV